MKIALIGSYPPSKNGLNEYNWYLAKELHNHEKVELSVLGDILPPRLQQQDKSEPFLIRCWDFNSVWTPLNVLRQLRKIKPDVVWFDIIFSAFGDKKIPALLGLLMPWMSRLFGFRTVITLHHLMEFIDFKPTKFKHVSLLDKWGGEFATRMLLKADQCFVTLKCYKKLLEEKYNAKNVEKMPHGFLVESAERAPLRGQNLLIFGKFGSYKRIDFMIKVFQEFRKKFPQATLTIAGRSHPSYPGYIEEAMNAFGGCSGVRFTGYVKEEHLADLFLGASVMILPYVSTTGVSGVAHLAAGLGLPIVASDLHDLKEMMEEEGITLATYPTEDAAALLKLLVDLFQHPERLQKMGIHNFEASKQKPIGWVVGNYLKNFERLCHPR